MLIAHEISGKEHPIQFVIIGNGLGFAFQGGFFYYCFYCCHYKYMALHVGKNTLQKGWGGATWQHGKFLAHISLPHHTPGQAVFLTVRGQVPLNASSCLCLPETQCASRKGCAEQTLWVTKSLLLGLGFPCRSAVPAPATPEAQHP